MCAVYCGHTYATIQLVNTALDYNYCSINVSGNGHVVASNSHIETTRDEDYVIKGSGDGIVVITDSVFYINQSTYSLIGVSGTSACKFVLKDNIKEVYSSPAYAINASSSVDEDWV